MNMIFIVNKSGQKKVLELLKNFESKITSDDYRFPLYVDFEEKIIFRVTSITCCAALSQYILRDLGKIKRQIVKNLKIEDTLTK